MTKELKRKKKSKSRGTPNASGIIRDDTGKIVGIGPAPPLEKKVPEPPKTRQELKEYAAALREFFDLPPKQESGGKSAPLARPRELRQGTPVRHEQTKLEQGQVDWGEKIRQLLGDLPTEYAERYAALQSGTHTFRSEVAIQLQPALNAHLRQMPQETYSEKQAIATWVNGQLRGLGLAIKCPRTGLPGNLVADRKAADSNISRFRIEVREESGKRTRSFSSRSLPDLELMEDAPREEPLLSWSKRADQSPKGRRRG